METYTHPCTHIIFIDAYYIYTYAGTGTGNGTNNAHAHIHTYPALHPSQQTRTPWRSHSMHLGGQLHASTGNARHTQLKNW